MSEPERVRSGSFQIDRKRALELLARYQLESPLHFPLAWVRAASAAQARSIELHDAPDRFSLVFDGTTYEESELAALLAGLPAETSDSRVRELARGTAAALPHVDAVTICSGWNALRATTEGETLERSPKPEARTTATAHWPNGKRPAAFDAVMAALERRSFPGRIVLGGRVVGRVPPGYWQPFEQEGVRGWLAPARRKSASELQLHQLGVACGLMSGELTGHAQVRALVDSPELQLDLSQGSFLRDERLEATLGKVGRAADAFALDATRRLSRVLPLIGEWLRDPVAYARWKERVTGLAPEGGIDGALLDAQRYFALDAGSAAERQLEIERWGPIVAWLRETALLLFGDGRRPQSDLERALWTAPLYLTVEGLPVSLEELERQRLRFGRLTVAERAYSGDPALPPAVEVADRRRMLELLVWPAGDRVNP